RAGAGWDTQQFAETPLTRRFDAQRAIPQQLAPGKETPMLRLLLALAATVVLGLASRLYPVGWFLYDRVIGEVLYAVAAYLVLAVLLARKPPWLIALMAFGC